MKVISPRGDYSARLRAIAAAGASLHIQFHADDWGRTGSRALCEVNERAGTRTRIIADELATDFGAIFAQGVSETRELSPGERGYSCIGGLTDGIIIEPVNLKDPRCAALIRKPEVQRQMAERIAGRLKQRIKRTETVALTLGHKFKTSSPYDEGASLAPGTPANPNDDTEADVMEVVLNLTIKLLENEEADVIRYTALCTSEEQASAFLSQAKKEAAIDYGYEFRIGSHVSVWASFADVKPGFESWCKGRNISRGSGFERMVRHDRNGHVTRV